MAGTAIGERVLTGVASLMPYRPGKPADALERELGLTDVVKLASNENPRGPGAPVRAAIATAIEQLSRYPDGGCFLLREAMASHLAVEPAQLTFGNGSNDVLDLIARVFLQPGRSAVIAEHAFIVYPIAIKATGGTMIEVPAIDYGADLAAMAAAIREDTVLVFLANPNNPTGTWVDGPALEAFLDQVPPDVVVVLDEAYFEYVAVSGAPDGVALLHRYPNLIVTRTFSKIYGLAALRVGYGVSSPELADYVNRVRHPFNVNALAQVAAVAALGDTDYVTQSRRLNAEGMATLTAELTARRIRFIPSAGNFVTYESGGDAAVEYDALLHQGVIVRPVVEYGLPRHLRVTVGTPEENARFLAALDAIHGARAS